VGTALQETGLVKNAKLINLYKPQTTEITEDDITFDRSLQQDELEEINFIPLSSEDAAVAIMEQLPKLDLAILGLPYPMNTEHFLWHLVERIKTETAEPTSSWFDSACRNQNSAHTEWKQRTPQQFSYATHFLKLLSTRNG